MSLGRPDFLSGILARKREEVADRRRALSDAQLERLCEGAPRPPPFRTALSRRGGAPRVIAEVKRRSPSVGAIANVDAVALATAYSAGGAAAISVLTDGPGFGGSLADLRSVADAIPAPCLRKDFIVDRYQLLEAKASGAAAALLIVAALEPVSLRSLLGACEALALDPLVEVHDRRELEVALEAGAPTIGINNRNLHTFVVDLAVSEALLDAIPADRVAVVESGVKTVDDARRLRAAGATNFLIGEALVRSADPAAFLAQLGALP